MKNVALNFNEECYEKRGTSKRNKQLGILPKEIDHERDGRAHHLPIERAIPIGCRLRRRIGAGRW